MIDSEEVDRLDAQNARLQAEAIFREISGGHDKVQRRSLELECITDCRECMKQYKADLCYLKNEHPRSSTLGADSKVVCPSSN